VPRRCEDVEHDRTARADLHLMWDVARDRPRVAWDELPRLVPDTEHERACEADAELLLLVAVLGHGAVRVELDDAERDALAVHGAAVHVFPDPLEIERRQALERGHRDEPIAAGSPPPTR